MIWRYVNLSSPVSFFCFSICVSSSSISLFYTLHCQPSSRLSPSHAHIFFLLFLSFFLLNLIFSSPYILFSSPFLFPFSFPPSPNFYRLRPFSSSSPLLFHSLSTLFSSSLSSSSSSLPLQPSPLHFMISLFLFFLPFISSSFCRSCVKIFFSSSSSSLSSTPSAPPSVAASLSSFRPTFWALLCTSKLLFNVHYNMFFLNYQRFLSRIHAVLTAINRGTTSFRELVFARVSCGDLTWYVQQLLFLMAYFVLYCIGFDEPPWMFINSADLLFSTILVWERTVVFHG